MSVPLALVAALLVFGVLACALAARRDAREGEDEPDAISKILGDWAGDSVCVGNRPACHDEQVIYHIVRKEGAPDTVTIAADKIVDGQPEQMGVLDFKYDAAKSTLTGEFTVNGTHGVWEYEVKGDAMEGTLKILPAGTLARRIKVKRAPNQAPAKLPRG